MKRWLPAAGLLLAAAWWLVLQHRLWPPDLFGEIQDETILVSTASSLASGQGYILPFLSAPDGAPARQTKYPVLYPWLLSLVWRWNPQFPANLASLAFVPLAFGLLALAASYLFLRHSGLDAPSAAAVTGFCALQPAFVRFSSYWMTDVPLMAFLLAAAVALDRTLETGRGWRLPLTAALLCALAALTRTVGLTVAAAGVFLSLRRRNYRLTALLLVSAALPLLVRPAASPPSDQWPPGFRQTWIYYTDYAGFWKLCVTTPAMLWRIVRTNAELSLLNLANGFWPLPPEGGPGALGWFARALVAALVLLGVVRQIRSRPWSAIHLILALQWAVFLFWAQSFYLTARYFLPFLPLFAAALWGECRYLLGAAAAAYRARRFAPAAIPVLAVAVLAGGVVLGFARQYRHRIAVAIPQRQDDLRERRELYAWIRRDTPASARFIACDDASLYLHTGRHALWPLAFTTGWFYLRNPGLWDEEARYIWDTARATGSRYWVVASDDLDWYQHTVWPRVARSPVLFTSSRGRVRVHDVSAELGLGP